MTALEKAKGAARSAVSFAKENIQVIDRVLVIIFVAWALSIAGRAVENRRADLLIVDSPDLKAKIEKIYEWCQFAFKPADDENQGGSK